MARQQPSNDSQPLRARPRNRPSFLLAMRAITAVTHLSVKGNRCLCKEQSRNALKLNDQNGS